MSAIALIPEHATVYPKYWKEATHAHHHRSPSVCYNMLCQEGRLKHSPKDALKEGLEYQI